MPGVVQISGALTGLTSGGTVAVGPFTITPNATGNFEELSVTLQSGSNTITIPTWAVGMIVVPPSGNTQTLTLKGISGDVGIVVSKTAALLVGFDTTPPASFSIAAGGAVTNPMTVWFF